MKSTQHLPKRPALEEGIPAPHFSRIPEAYIQYVKNQQFIFSWDANYFFTLKQIGGITYVIPPEYPILNVTWLTHFSLGRRDIPVTLLMC